MWKGGRKWKPPEGKRGDYTGEEMDGVLRNMREKALGLDHWRPKALLVLPRRMKEELVERFNEK